MFHAQYHKIRILLGMLETPEALTPTCYHGVAVVSTMQTVKATQYHAQNNECVHALKQDPRRTSQVAEGIFPV